MDRFHKLIIWAANAAGANFVDADKPTGDKQSSPSTTRKKLRTSQSGLTKLYVPLNTAGKIMTINESPAKINPKENFCGVLG